MPYINSIDKMINIVSITVTCISIVCSIWSFCSARKAKSYKEKVKTAINIIDIQKLAVEFDYESNKFVDATRKEDWYKGIDPNTVISPLSGVLTKFTAVYPILDYSRQLKDLVTTVYKNIQQYESAAPFIKRATPENIMEISTHLHQYLQKSINEI